MKMIFQLAFVTILMLAIFLPATSGAQIIDDGNGTVTIVGKLVIAGSLAGASTEICVQCSSWQYGLKINYSKEIMCDPAAQNTTCPCPLFDYEQGERGGGYYAGQSVNGVLFNINACENIDAFVVDGFYSIRATIIEPASGVYFTSENYANYNNSHACSLDCGGASAVVSAGSQKIYVSSHPFDNESECCVTSCEFPPSDYALDYYPLTVGETLYEPSIFENCDCCFTCGTNRVKSVETCSAQILRAGMPLLLIDLPMFVYDTNDINICFGKSTVVRVSIVDVSGTELCSCDVLLGIFQ